MGVRRDPRRAGRRADLAGRATVEPIGENGPYARCAPLRSPAPPPPGPAPTSPSSTPRRRPAPSSSAGRGTTAGGRSPRRSPPGDIVLGSYWNDPAATAGIGAGFPAGTAHAGKPPSVVHPDGRADSTSERS